MLSILIFGLIFVPMNSCSPITRIRKLRHDLPNVIMLISGERYCSLSYVILDIGLHVDYIEIKTWEL